MFEFKILARDKKARVGEFKTAHGELLTPELAFVATEGEIKSIPEEILPKLPVNLIIVNTFHIYTNNILSGNDSERNPDSAHVEKTRYRFSQLIEAPPPKSSRSLKSSKKKSSFSQRVLTSGKLLTESNKITKDIHTYSNFPRVIMSDSGGFQVFSLGFAKVHGVGKIANIFPGHEKPISDSYNLLKITDKGVTFPYNDQFITLSPKLSIKLQHKIGSDIMFAFDECTSPLNTKKYTAEALERTHQWLKMCLSSHKKYQEKQALFGIVQGGYFEDLRKDSAEFVGKQNVPGFGIGGTLGRSKKDMHNILDWIIPLLPDEKPRHLLGIGQIRDIFESVERGVDLFDCVIPTREARHKVLYTKKGKINLRKMKNIDEVIDKNCQCQTCINNLTLKRLNNLFSLKDPLSFFYSTIHNIQFYSDLMTEIRESINKGKFFDLKEKYLKFY